MKISMNGVVRDATPEEIKSFKPANADRIAELKQALSDTDYKAIKYAEGWLTTEEYEPVKVQRQQWREEINRLETEAGQLSE